MRSRTRAMLPAVVALVFLGTGCGTMVNIHHPTSPKPFGGLDYDIQMIRGKGDTGRLRYALIPLGVADLPFTILGDLATLPVMTVIGGVRYATGGEFFPNTPLAQDLPRPTPVAP